MKIILKTENVSNFLTFLSYKDQRFFDIKKTACFWRFKIDRNIGAKKVFLVIWTLQKMSYDLTKLRGTHKRESHSKEVSVIFAGSAGHTETHRCLLFAGVLAKFTRLSCSSSKWSNIWWTNFTIFLACKKWPLFHGGLSDHLQLSNTKKEIIWSEKKERILKICWSHEFFFIGCVNPLKKHRILFCYSPKQSHFLNEIGRYFYKNK